MRITAPVVLALSLHLPVAIGSGAGVEPRSSDRGRALELQVRLDRAGFSPGEIDGAPGANTRRALQAYARARRLDETSEDAAAAALAAEQNVPVLTRYRIAAADVAGPFVEKIPEDLMAQAELDTLAFRNPLESLAEKLHASPALLRRLNPRAAFADGEEIEVPNVVVGPPRTIEDHVTVVVRKSTSSAEARRDSGELVFYAPVTSGSEHDPLPIGNWKVTAILWSPKFHYNPDLFWDADPGHAKATIAAGPNNPVGVVWIDLDKPHYGLHGTPEPSTVGKTSSHGCVRLTNWDAARLTALVRPGTPVNFVP
jgi:lipoprotein-anchoring transpeptidase ErfK/SrfK